MKMKLTIAAGFIVFLCTFYSCSNEVNCPSENLEQSDSIEGSRSFQSTYKLKSYIHRYVNDYIKTVPSNNYGVNGYYVEMTGEGDAVPHISTDEAMGYGMRICIQGADLATSYGEFRGFEGRFQGLWEVQSKFMKFGLSSWLIPKSLNPQDASTSATDGSLDIAYALIMAHNKFGSAGGSDNIFNYKSQAFKMIRTLAQKSVTTKKINGRDVTYILTGNMVQNPVGNRLDLVTRPSDWTLHHFRTFKKFIETEYSAVLSNATMKKQWYDPWVDLIEGTEYLISLNPFGSGLFPDFIKLKEVGGNNHTLEALDPNGTEAKALGENVGTNIMSWNACRLPWRLAMDHSNYGGYITRNALEKMKKTLHSGYDISTTGVEYYLNGQKKNNYVYAAFAAPIAATWIPMYKSGSWGAARYASKIIQRDTDILINMFQGSHPGTDQHGYFTDSINIFCLLLLTGEQYVPYK